MVKYHRLRFNVTPKKDKSIPFCERLGSDKFHVYQEQGDNIYNKDEFVVWNRETTGIEDCSSLDAYLLNKTELKKDNIINRNKPLHDKYIKFLSFMKNFKEYDFVLGTIEDKFNVSIHVKPNPIEERIGIEIYNINEKEIIAAPQASYNSKNITENIIKFLEKKIPQKKKRPTKMFSK